jgi:DNA-binding CsgD family transcriptional regulator
MLSTDARRAKISAASLAGVFALVALLAGADLAYDLRAGNSAFHIALEGALVVAVSLGGFVPMVARFRSLVLHTQALKARAEGLEQRADDLAQRAGDLEEHAGRLKQRADDLEQRLAASRSEADVWRREAGELIAGLSAAIDRQLDQWALSPAEKEVALLLLKGLSHKEIAEVRGVSEATVRQQARALYRKAGLNGRHDLAAFFLEELLEPKRRDAPAQPRDGPVTAERSPGGG